MLFPLLFTLSIFLWLYPSLISCQTCNQNIYGSVDPYDCHRAIDEIPFALVPTTSYQSRNLRLFAEPQFQTPKFGYVNNQFRPQNIVQLPKIWKHGESAARATIHGGRSSFPAII